MLGYFIQNNSRGKIIKNDNVDLELVIEGKTVQDIYDKYFTIIKEHGNYNIDGDTRWNTSLTLLNEYQESIILNARKNVSNTYGLVIHFINNTKEHKVLDYEEYEDLGL